MKISIVMPSFNQSQFVTAAIESVLSQDYDRFEVLFIDGGSTDDTMSIVDVYRDRLTYCISEPDNGQSDALHKGFLKATGDVLTWLNTDDLLLPGTLRRVAQTFSQAPNTSWILGNTIWIDKNDRILRCWRGEGYTPGWPRLGLLAAGGPSSFFTRDLYERVGGLNLQLHYQMDTELWWRFAMSGEKFVRLNGYSWALRLHEAAKVSGHMFADRDNSRQTKIQHEKNVERAHIEAMTAGYTRRLPFVSSALSIARKITSPAYIHGLVDHMLWNGRSISELSKLAR